MVESVLSAAAELGNVLLTAVDRDGRLVRFNAACEVLTGWKADEVLGSPFYETLVPGEESEEVRLRVESVLAGNYPNTGENTWLTRTGERRLISWSDTALLDESGEVQLVVSSGIDITQHKRIEDELRRHEERYRTLVEQLPLVIYIDRLDELSSKIYTSPQVTSLLGYEAAEWERDEGLFVRLLHPDDRERVLAEHRRVRETGEPLELEYRLIGHDGEVVWVRDGGIVLRDEAGEPRFLQGYLLDITARKEHEAERSRLEEQLRQAQKMEAIGRLAGGIAHDFNNLLTAIQGYSDLALTRIEEGDRDAQRRDLEEIRRAADRASQLTRQLLAFGRRQMLQPKVLDLNAVVGDMESMLRRLIGEDVELVTDLDRELGTVRADPNQVEQVLMNLVVNARDAMPDGGRLVVGTRNAAVAEGATRERVAVQPGDYAVLVVSDTGEGMTDDVRERIFEPFFTTKPAGEGSGLGLATVYGIVKQSGGYIWVESTPGEGTAFHVYLPLDGRAAEQEGAEKPRSAVRGAESVLVVEDEEAVRTMVRRVLEGHGYTVLVAANGLEALELVRRSPTRIDLLVTDVVMPGMGGVALADAARLVRPHLPVILMSGYADGALRSEALAGTTFLQKPFSPSALATLVRRALEERAAA
jgi:PAS domain S-box-containing protein